MEIPRDEIERDQFFAARGSEGHAVERDQLKEFKRLVDIFVVLINLQNNELYMS
jgi:hypothetical protein